MVKKELIERKITELFGNRSGLVKRLISPAIGIKLIDKTERSNQTQPKVGGWPNANQGFVWPHEAGHPLTFLCQINLAELWKFQSILPTTGMLYFFVANEQFGEPASLENTFKVIYHDNLADAKSFTEKTTQLDEYDIEFYEHYTLPSYQEQARLGSEILAELSDCLDEFQRSISELTYEDGDFTNHHLLGDPNAVQGSVRSYWGAKFLNPHDLYYEEMRNCLRQASQVGNEFILLLQIDLLDQSISLPQYGSSCLYFGMLKEDLIAKNFERVKLVMQST